MKTIVLIILVSAVALADDLQTAQELEMSLEDFELSMAFSGILLASFFNFMLWKMAP